MMKAVICRSTGLMWINYFKDSEETSVQWHMQDFVNGEAFRSFSEESTGSEIGGYHPGKFCKLPASQSPSKICRAAAVGKNVMRRLVSRILASVVNAWSCRYRGLLFMLCMVRFI